VLIGRELAKLVLRLLAPSRKRVPAV